MNLKVVICCLAMAGFCSMLLLSGCKKEESVITLSYANFPPDSTFPCIQMEHWKQEVETRTGGRVKVNTFPGGTLLGAKDIFDGVVAGTADIGNFAMSYQPGRFPVSEAVDLPHFFADARTASRILAELLEKFQPAEFQEVKILTAFTCPPGVVMSSQKATSVDDLKSLSLRSSGTMLDPMKLLGANPVAMPQSDIPDALQKGVIKGIVSSAEVLKDMNYAKYCKWVLVANLPVTSFAVVMNKAKFDSLPEDIKAILNDLYYEQCEWTAKYVDQHVQDALAWSKTDQQVEITSISNEDVASLKNRLEPVFADYCKRLEGKNLDGQKILDFIRTNSALQSGK